MKKIAIYIAGLLVCISTPVFSQDAIDTVSSLKGIEIQTSVDKAEVYIGDLINYKLTILFDSTYQLEPPPLGANLGAFDVKDYESDKQTVLNDGRIQSESRFTLSTFTTGEYVIPPIPVLFTLPDGTRKALLSEGVPIKVQSLLFNTDDSADIRPLKAQFEFKRDLTKYYWYGAGAFVLIVGLLYLLYWYRKRRAGLGEIEDTREPWEIAFERMAMLKQEQHAENKQYKLYYIELTELYRAYLEAIYQDNYLDMTTEEFSEAFAEAETPNGTFDKTMRLFKHADLVKFAKYVPEHERMDSDYQEVYSLIESIRVDYVRKQEAETNLPDSNGDAETEPDKQEVAQ